MLRVQSNELRSDLSFHTPLLQISLEGCPYVRVELWIIFTYLCPYALAYFYYNKQKCCYLLIRTILICNFEKISCYSF